MISVRFATKTTKASENTMMAFVRRLPNATRPRTLFELTIPVPEVISASTPVASSPQRNRNPTAMKLDRSDEPPWLMNGKVRPVSGISPVTPPTMMNA